MVGRRARGPSCPAPNTRQPEPRRSERLPTTGEPRATMVACTKCDWKAAYNRDELFALYGADRVMPDLLNDLAAPGCLKIGSNWDRCGAHFVEPIDGPR